MNTASFAPLCTVALWSAGILAIAQPATATPITLQFQSSSGQLAPISTTDSPRVSTQPLLPNPLAPQAAPASPDPDRPLPIPTGAKAAPIGEGSTLAELPPPPPTAAPPPSPAPERPANAELTEGLEDTGNSAEPVLTAPVASADGLDFGLSDSPALQSPTQVAAAPSAPDDSLPDRLKPLFEGGIHSLVAIAVGHAEGTRTATGEKTPAYQGHTDPGNGVWNLGTFSFQHGASSPEEADAQQLQRLGQQATTLLEAAEARGIPLSLEEQLNAIDLANQAPAAALNLGGYLDRLTEARSMGLQRKEAILWARTRSYLDPDTRQWNAPGLGNTVDRISADQERRMQAIARVLATHPIPENLAATEEEAIAQTLLSLDRTDRKR